jgi:acetyl-CoA acetyltransferase
VAYDEMGAAASRMALSDAGIGYESVQQAYAGYVYGDSTAGQKAIYPLGLTGIPIINVNNNCSTGSTALFLGRQAVASGAADCVLVLGFEQMRPGALGSIFADRPSPFEDFHKVTDRLVDAKEIPLALRYFGGDGLSHMKLNWKPSQRFAQKQAGTPRTIRLPSSVGR